MAVEGVCSSVESATNLHPVMWAPSYVGSLSSYVDSLPSYVGSLPSYVGSLPSYVGSLPSYVGRIVLPSYVGKVFFLVTPLSLLILYL